MAGKIDPDIDVAKILAFAKSQKEEAADKAAKDKDPEAASFFAGQEMAYDVIASFIVK